jgi:hypothetical protein
MTMTHPFAQPGSIEQAARALPLPERRRLLAALAQSVREDTRPSSPSEGNAQLDRLLDELAALPIEGAAPAVSNRDHDQLLYGPQPRSTAP